MKSPLLIQTKNQNKYFYSPSCKQFIINHPILFHLLELHKNNEDLYSWIDKLPDNDIQISTYGKFSKQEIEHYFQKFQFFKNNDFFNDVDLKEKLSGTITSKNIEDSFNNTNRIVFEVTEDCNLNCKYCTFGELYEKRERETNSNLDSELAINLIGKILKEREKTRYLNIGFYGGEPFLNFEFIERVVMFSKKNSENIRFSTTMNGTLLLKYMDFIVANNFNLSVSLDGDFECNSYRLFKNGNSSFDLVYNNLLALKEKYPKYYAERVNIMSVLHNKNSVQQIHDFIKTKLDKIPDILNVSPYDIDSEHKEEFENMYRNTSESMRNSENYSQLEKDLFDKLPDSESLLKLYYNQYSNAYKDYNQLMNHCSSQNKSCVPTATCFPFNKMIFVTAHGEILPCNMINHGYILGKISKHKMELDFNAIAQKYNGIYDQIRNLCSNCYRAMNCNQCMFNLDLNQANVKCKGFQNQKEYSDYLSLNLESLENNPVKYTKILNEINLAE